MASMVRKLRSIGSRPSSREGEAMAATSAVRAHAISKVIRAMVGRAGGGFNTFDLANKVVVIEPPLFALAQRQLPCKLLSWDQQI